MQVGYYIKGAKGSQSTGHAPHTRPQLGAAFPKGRGDFSSPKASVHLPGHRPARLPWPRAGTFFYFIEKSQGPCPCLEDSDLWAGEASVEKSLLVGRLGGSGPELRVLR